MNPIRECSADKIEEWIAATPTGGVCKLPQGAYYLTRRVEIRGRQNIVIDGGGSQIVAKYRSNADYTHSTDVFLVENCDGVTLQNFVIDTDVAPNIRGKIEEIDFEGESIVVKVDDSFPMRGDEVLMATEALHDEYDYPTHDVHHFARNPDQSIVTVMQGEIHLAITYGSASYDYLGDNRFRICFPNEKSAMRGAKLGMTVNVRHTMYGPGVFVLRNSNRTVIRDVTLHATAGMGIIVLPRCEDLTVERVRFIPKEGSRIPLACNCDGMHVTGLGGRLILRDCVFDGMGDDPLNVHATAGTVTSILGEGTVKCNYCKKRPDGVLPAKWCAAGDVIRFYNPNTLQKTAEAKVVGFADGVLKYELLEGAVSLGDTMQNMFFAPSVLIDRCTARRSLARFFVIQTEDVTIQNCTMFGTRLNAIKAAPDLDFWYEVGPVQNLSILNNHFARCGGYNGEGAIELNTNHQDKILDVRALHRNIRIEGNTFADCIGEHVILLCSCDNVALKNNRMINCACDEEDAITERSCTNVIRENNIFTKE